ncbi:hypothetical protein [Streptomyces caeni]|uniref:hypothetical protein n=1 Tax=Streptomyces caeni TaxID=2307231 RepID=UPI0036D27F5B
MTLRHPNLPEGQEIRVPRSAVPHYRSAGWVPADSPSTDSGPATEQISQAGVEGSSGDTPAQPVKRRRATSKET